MVNPLKTPELEEMLKLPICEKIRLLDPPERNFILRQIDALLKARQPFSLSDFFQPREEK